MIIKTQIQRIYSFINSFIHLSMVLQPFGPRIFFSFVIFFTQTVGLLGRVISPSQGRYLHTEQHKHRINAHTDNHALSGIRIHDPSNRASEDSSCLRQRGHCDRLNEHIRAINNNKDTSTYAQYIFNTGYTYGNIQNTMEIIQIARNGKHMNNFEKVLVHCIYHETQRSEILWRIDLLLSGDCVNSGRCYIAPATYACKVTSRNNRRDDTGCVLCGPAPRLYDSTDRVKFQSWQLQRRIKRASGVGSWRNNWEKIARKELGCAKKTS
jgi:hypothetical protein